LLTTTFNSSLVVSKSSGQENHIKTYTVYNRTKSVALNNI